MVVDYSSQFYPSYTVVALYPYYGLAPTPPEVDDDRANPKMWAQWFREFLEELLPARVYIPCLFSLFFSVASRYIYLARSGPQLREWKMKRWKQALPVTI